MKTATPRLETLPQSQRNLWSDLGAAGSDFVLYGGTALSLQVGGRQSLDFDFFTPRPLDPGSLSERFHFLRDATLIQRGAATASYSVNCPDPVKVSFFGTLDFGRVDQPCRFPDNGLIAAGLLDLAAQKVKVVQQRAGKKDYIDICTLLENGITLEQALGAARSLYPQFNPMISLKALTFFSDGDLRTLSEQYQNLLVASVARVREIPVIPKLSPSLLADPE
ncbi:MAG: nucleotidyl transferase AbiEii/AbiGii toxin family protein [Opitutaceae bacterium]